MRLKLYNLPGSRLMIRPAEAPRAWMGETVEGFAARCLPMVMANQHGWEILSPSAFTAVWDGTADASGIRIFSDDGKPEMIADSLHGHGVLTMAIPGLLRTDPGYDLWLTGPPNVARDGIAPLTGLVESDWYAGGVNMHYRFTRAGVPVSFATGEPFAFAFPVKRGFLEEVEVETLELKDEPELLGAFTAWVDTRGAYNATPRSAGALEWPGWAMGYARGRNMAGPDAPPDHRRKLRLRSF